MGKLMNILPVSDLRQDAAKVLKQLRDNKEPIIITQRGRAAAVIIGVEACEKSDVNVRFTPSARTQFLSALSYIRQDKPFFIKPKPKWFGSLQCGFVMAKKMNNYPKRKPILKGGIYYG